jgi:Flp pilus assembly pilin Flp
MNLFKRLWTEESGQDLTEYALLLVLIALASIATLRTTANAISTFYSQAMSNLAGAAP